MDLNILAVFFFVTVIATIGIIAFVIGVRNLYFATVSLKWPVASGRILKSRLKCDVDEGAYRYFADIVYEYEVGRKTHTSDNIYFGYTMTGCSEPHRMLAESNPVGSQAEVRYNPDSPDMAVLYSGVKTYTCMNIYIGIGSLVVAAALFLSVYW